MPTVKVALLVLLLVSSLAIARVWTDNIGRATEADLVRVEGNSVILRKATGDVRCPTNRLCQVDLDYIRDWQAGNAAPASSPPADPEALSIQGQSLIAGGRINTYEFAYSAEDLKILRRDKSKETKYKIAIAVPADFDPQKPQHVFMASAPGNNENEIRAGDCAIIGMYAKTCTDNGWVCMTTDSDLGNESDGDKALVCSLQALLKEWPGMSGWEFAVGGFSGGAKGCFYPCASLIREKYKVIGAFMGGCNEDYSERARKARKAPAAGYRTIRAFLSAGAKDTIATLSHNANVRKSLKANGIRDCRVEIHEEGHTLFQPHLEKALKWFAEDRPKDKGATPLRRLPTSGGAGAAL